MNVLFKFFYDFHRIRSIFIVALELLKGCVQPNVTAFMHQEVTQEGGETLTIKLTLLFRVSMLKVALKWPPVLHVKVVLTLLPNFHEHEVSD